MTQQRHDSGAPYQALIFHDGAASETNREPLAQLLCHHRAATW